MNAEEEIVLDLSDLIFDEKYIEIKKREFYDEKIEISKPKQIKLKVNDKNYGGYRDLTSKIPSRARDIEELSEDIIKYKNTKLSKGNEKHSDRGKTKVNSSIDGKNSHLNQLNKSAQQPQSDHYLKLFGTSAYGINFMSDLFDEEIKKKPAENVEIGSHINQIDKIDQIEHKNKKDEFLSPLSIKDSMNLNRNNFYEKDRYDKKDKYDKRDKHDKHDKHDKRDRDHASSKLQDSKNEYINNKLDYKSKSSNKKDYVNRDDREKIKSSYEKYSVKEKDRDKDNFDKHDKHDKFDHVTNRSKSSTVFSQPINSNSSYLKGNQGNQSNQNEKLEKNFILESMISNGKSGKQSESSQMKNSQIASTSQLGKLLFANNDSLVSNKENNFNSSNSGNNSNLNLKSLSNKKIDPIHARDLEIFKKKMIPIFSYNLISEKIPSYDGKCNQSNQTNLPITDKENTGIVLDNPLIKFYKSSFEDPQINRHLFLDHSLRLHFLKRFPQTKNLISKDYLYNIINNKVDKVYGRVKISLNINSNTNSHLPIGSSKTIKPIPTPLDSLNEIFIFKNLYYVKIVKDEYENTPFFTNIFVTENTLKNKLNIWDPSRITNVEIENERECEGY